MIDSGNNSITVIGGKTKDINKPINTPIKTIVNPQDSRPDDTESILKTPDTNPIIPQQNKIISSPLNSQTQSNTSNDTDPNRLKANLISYKEMESTPQESNSYNVPLPPDDDFIQFMQTNNFYVLPIQDMEKLNKDLDKMSEWKRLLKNKRQTSTK